MDIKITFRGMETDAAIEKHIRAQLKTIADLVDKEHGPAKLEFIVEKRSKFPNFAITARMHKPTCHCVAQHEGADIYAEINEVSDRLYQELVKCKEWQVDRKKQGCDGECRNERYLKDEAAAEFEVEEFIDLEDEE